MDDVSHFVFLQIHAIVAANHVGKFLVAGRVGSGKQNITSCPITFYGRTYTWMHVSKLDAYLGELLVSLPLLSDDLLNC